jgi:hypothetical protein
MRAAEATFADAPRHVIEVALQDCGHLGSWVESVRLAAFNRLQALADTDTSIDPETVAAESHHPDADAGRRTVNGGYYFGSC